MDEYCGYEVDDVYSGEVLDEVMCEVCGTIQPVENKICSYCGAKIQSKEAKKARKKKRKKESGDYVPARKKINRKPPSKPAAENTMEKPKPMEKPTPMERPKPIERPTPIVKPKPVDIPKPIEKPKPVDIPKPIEKPKMEFNDLSSSHWAYEAIEELAEKGILNGKGDANFVPDDGVTLEEFVKIIAVAFDLTADSEIRFADVEADRWSADYIAAAAAHGIVTGDGESFNPAQVITRQDMAVIIYRVFEHLGLEVSGDVISFDDDAEISDYAKKAVEALTAAGIINGMGDGTFAPKTNVTRAQSAKVVYGLLQLVGGGK